MINVFFGSKDEVAIEFNEQSDSDQRYDSPILWVLGESLGIVSPYYRFSVHELLRSACHVLDYRPLRILITQFILDKYKGTLARESKFWIKDRMIPQVQLCAFDESLAVSSRGSDEFWAIETDEIVCLMMPTLPDHDDFSYRMVPASKFYGAVIEYCDFLGRQIGCEPGFERDLHLQNARIQHIPKSLFLEFFDIRSDTSFYKYDAKG